MVRQRVLILGGTGEARELAAALEPRPEYRIVSSLAGRVREPALPAGAVHIGGFGGVDGLTAYLREEHVDSVVDATHPFARGISAHAVAACAAARVPLLVLRRPGWAREPDDLWYEVPSVAAAADAALDWCAQGNTVSVTTGRQDLAPYAGDDARHYLIRAVDPPTGPLPRHHTLVLDRGPYTLEGELALMRSHGVRVLVSKDSGGAMTYPKIEAARHLRLPVVLVARAVPSDASAATVPAVSDAVAWLDGSEDRERPPR